MKKTIRLTETDLVQLVQRIIKEDEMSGTEISTTTTPKGFVPTSLKQLLSTQKELSGYYGGKANNDYQYYKAYYPDAFGKIIGGRAFEQTPGGFGDIRPRIALEKTILMKEGGRLEVSIQTKTENLDTYTLTCNGGKVSITGGSVGP